MTYFCARCDIRTQCPGPTKTPGRIEFAEFDWFASALASDRFTFHFQPIVNAGNALIHAHESLVRLHHDRWFSGGEIIEAAVRLGHVHVFDSYCRSKALRTAATQAGDGSVVFVNFMPSSIYDPAYCLQSTLAALGETHLKSKNVVFEVVESEQVNNVQNLIRIRDFYRKHGFGFALDDCGTGSNTVSMVERFEPEYLKLDKSLTSLEATASNQRELDRLIEAGSRRGCKIIAEGIETPEQALRLQKAGITLMQGWLFGRPAPEMLSASSLAQLAKVVSPETPAVTSV